ncbi:hypothetical protein T08_14236 [Trichinella sp. T8]|nr:hypothetical protein T08_14236 [Trichinella sp. T8]
MNRKADGGWSCNIRIKDDFKGNLTSNIVYIQYGQSRYTTPQNMSAEYVYANVNEGEHCRWHFAACTLCHANPERTALLYKCSLLNGGLISYCIALFGDIGTSLQQIRCDC